jgi:hypothetical protein
MSDGGGKGQEPRGGTQRAVGSARPGASGQQASRNNNTVLKIQGREDSSSGQLWGLSYVLFKAWNEALTLRNAKYGTTSGDVYENTGDNDKMSCLVSASLHENAPIEGLSARIMRTFWPKVQGVRNNK